MAHAGSYVTTLQPSSTTTDDSYLREDGVTEENGDKSELRIKSSEDPKNRNIIVRIPPGLANRTILQAWLKLTQSAGNSSIPMDTRVYPLTESWAETEVSWRVRDRGLLGLAINWSTAGGTHGPAWTDRQFVSEDGVGTETSWQVGPILQAWNLGTLAVNGLIIEPRHEDPERENVFRSSETGTASQRPRLVIHYTDEAPAIREGVAETQPRTLSSGSVNARLTIHLDVDAAGSTPSGTATGFDQITLAHKGAFVVTALDSFFVNGASPGGTVSFTDNGSSVTIKCPRIMAAARVRAVLRVSVLAPATSIGIDLPVTVDDTATPGAWAQALWPGDADGIPANGDDWILRLASSTAQRIYVDPDTTSMVERTCMDFEVIGEDASGFRFPVSADSFSVYPRTSGTITRDGLFCPSVLGTMYVIAYRGSLWNYAMVQVTPAITPVVAPPVLRTAQAALTDTLAPADTMLLDVSLSEGDGFRDVQRIDFTLAHGSQASSGSPATRAVFSWSRTSGWSLVDPTNSSWRLLPSSCVVDTVTNSTATQTVRLGFVVGQIARFSVAGEWTANVDVFSATPSDTASSTRAGLQCRRHIVATARDTSAAFSSGEVGATRLPLVRPTDGRVVLHVISNAPYDLKASATDMAGTFSPGDTLFVRAPNQRIPWARTPSGTDGYLDTTWTVVASARPAATQETATDEPFHLWVNHPASIPVQTYRGDLRLRVSGTGVSEAAFTGSMPLRATVVSGGLAAQSALAEVVPHTAPAGAVAQPFDVYLLPQFQGTETGINHIFVDLPDGYSSTSVAAVEVAGAPVVFTDRSSGALAEVVLATRVTTPSVVRLRLVSTVPTVLDSMGSSFVLLYDDDATPLLQQAAVEGNANGVSDGNSWNVAVTAGPLSRLEITPTAVTTYVGQTTVFDSRGYDAYGHPVPPATTWAVEGGIGSITGGSFTATAAGIGRVIARSGALADTAEVRVWTARAIALRSVRGPASVHQGASAMSLVARIENLGGDAVALDTLRLSFSRGASGDADDDFAVVAHPDNPDTLPAAASLELAFDVTVASQAMTGPLSVNARASGVEVVGGGRLGDAAADTALVLQVRPGGVELTATQPSGTVRPGQALVPILSLRVRNVDPEPHTLTRLTLRNQTSGPGDTEALDAALGDVQLFADDGDGTLEALQDTLLQTTTALDGQARFVSLHLPLGADAERRLILAVNPPLSVRDGEVLDLAAWAPEDVVFERELGFRNAWPLAPGGSLMVDGMVAAQIPTAGEGLSALPPGRADAPVFRLRVPANGYVADELRRLAVVNLGTARPDSDIARVRAWTDDGDGPFQADDARLLGALTHTGDRWELTGIIEPVPLGGLPLVFTVDLTPLAAERRTIQLALPGGMDPGLGLASGNSGPLDEAVASPSVQTVSDVDRVTVTAMPLSGGSARPGDRGLALLHLVASNSYTTPRRLASIVATNLTAGPGTQGDLDGETQRLSLREDGDGDGVLDDVSIDPLMADGFFTGGVATFNGLDWQLPAGASRHLWVTADVPLVGAADGDVLGCAVSGPLEFGFVEPTTITGEWPLDSRARWTIDGLVAAQVTRAATPAASLGPGEGPALALDLVLPPNGYRSDLLRGLFVVNLGSAQPSELAALELWRDGGDGVFSGGTGGDDAPLGTLAAQNGGWQSALLAASVAPPGGRFFVAVTVGAAPAESATVRLAVPVHGLQFESGNDGPTDQAIESSDALQLSSSPLLASLEVAAVSTLGQPVEVRMRLRNAGGERIQDAAPSALEISGPAALTPIDGPTPPAVTIDPGSTATITWRLSAAAVGETRFLASATGIGTASGLARRAPRATSPLHRVFAASSHVDLAPSQTMPANVNPGEAGVVPVSLTLTNPGGPGVADVRLRALRVRLETEAGAPIVPADLLSRIAVHEGTQAYLSRTALETSGSEMDLTLATPVSITGTEPTTLSLRLDLSPTTTVPTFRLVVDDSASFVAEDAVGSAPVTVRLEAPGFPLRTNVARVIAGATDVDVTAAAAPETVRAARAGVGVPLARARFVSRGVAAITADGRVSRFAVVTRDGLGIPVGAGSRLRELRVVHDGGVVARATLTSSSPSTTELALSPPLNLPAGQAVDILVEGDLAAEAVLGAFQLAVADTSRIEAYDAISRAPLQAHLAPDPLPGAQVIVEAASESLLARHAPTFPSSVVIGAQGVSAVAFTLRHPGGAETARIRLDSLQVALRDDQRRPLAARTYVDRASLRRGGVEIAALDALPVSASFTLPLAGLLLAPGDSAALSLRIDVEASAPAGTLELLIGAPGLHARDANTERPVTLVAESGFDLPMLSGLARLELPSRELVVGMTSRMPAVAAADGRPIVAAEIGMTNRDPEGTGPVAVPWLRIRASDDQLQALPIGPLATSVEAWVGGVRWASAALSPDSATVTLTGDWTLSVPEDSLTHVELRWTPRPGAVADRVRLGLDRPDVGVAVSSGLLAVQVLPAPGQTFPLWSDAAGFGAIDLPASYANFPNPFAAGRQSTAFAYYLSGAGRVTLRILTARGEPVATLLDNAPKSPGQHEQDRWDGRNGRGQVVQNGVYVAELVVRYDAGGAERCLRKVAVVR